MPSRRGTSALTKGAVAFGAVALFAGHHGHVPPPTHAARVAIAYEKARLGLPYCWGGTGPSCYDCSGLAMEAYASAGITIPRISQQQWAQGVKVPSGDQRPGDLVFFAGADGTWSAPGHVGIVLGPHRMIEAYAIGYPVRVSQYGTPSSPPGDQSPVGFTRPSAGA